ncbi:MAG: 50S ribosomal protein L24 [Chloroflexi bacterium RBG_16_63_12]|jgi:large subunit ribosomal protein L24|nr:MAG: 50S ribosomal protein L24 [Chloroflexi bacterium RBG_16_63_12]
MNIKKGDTVQLIAGKDRGKRGEVLKVLPTENRVVVQGLNLRKKHQRARQAQVRGGQTAPEILVFDGPMDAANVMLVCPKCGEAVRVGHQRDGDKAVRVCRNCKSVIDA